MKAPTQRQHLPLLPLPPQRLAPPACGTVRLTGPAAERELRLTRPVAEWELRLTRRVAEPELRSTPPVTEPRLSEQPPASIVPPRPVEAQELVPVLRFESDPAEW